jgi:hypothetical protein
MAVQDDGREHELARTFNLDWDPDHERGGGDAELIFEHKGQKYKFDVELKSTTGSTVSTARDVGIEHIQKWRKKLFVIGFYSKGNGRPRLQHCLCLTPIDMEPWIRKVESKIATDFDLAEHASKKLELEDLFRVCGKKDAYTMKDAKRLHKQQWNDKQYKAARDMKVGNAKMISPGKMLEILKLRCKYIAERGATLNNPHITKAHLAKFLNTTRRLKETNAADGIRTIAKEFVDAHPAHPAAVVIPSTALA